MPHPPFREPLPTTLRRTVPIALIVAAAITLRSASSRPHFLSLWPTTSLLILWPALGGHYVELLYLNHLRPHLSNSRPPQILARLLTWFAGGAALALAMHLTAIVFESLSLPSLAAPRGTGELSRTAGRVPLATCALGGLAFIALELIVHAILHLRHLPNFYTGQA